MKPEVPGEQIEADLTAVFAVLGLSSEQRQAIEAKSMSATWKDAAQQLDWSRARIARVKRALHRAFQRSGIRGHRGNFERRKSNSRPAFLKRR
jgi:hypothetical protein